MFQKANSWLKPGGLIIVSSGGSKEEIPSFSDKMFGADFDYDSQTIDNFLRQFSEAGFDLIEKVLVNEPDGERDKGRLGCIFRKR